MCIETPDWAVGRGGTSELKMEGEKREKRVFWTEKSICKDTKAGENID